MLPFGKVLLGAMLTAALLLNGLSTLATAENEKAKKAKTKDDLIHVHVSGIT